MIVFQGYYNIVFRLKDLATIKKPNPFSQNSVSDYIN